MDPATVRVDVSDQILIERRPGPQKPAGLTIKGINDAGLARNARDYFLPLSASASGSGATGVSTRYLSKT
jgi:hypothetical protein